MHYGFRPSFEVLRRLSGRSGVLEVGIPWGGIWLVFLVWWGTALRMKWLQIREAGRE
jgi:hypothetical protein